MPAAKGSMHSNFITSFYRGLKKVYAVSLYRNSIYLILSWAASPFFSYVFWILIAKYFTSDDLGTSNALISAIGLLSLFSTLGLNIGLIKFLPTENDRSGILNSCLTISGLLNLLLTAVFILGIDFWMPKLAILRSDVSILVFFIIFSVANVFVVIERNIFIAYRSSRFYLVMQGTAGVLRIAVILVMVFYWQINDVYQIFLSWGIALFVTTAIGGFFIRNRQPDFFPRPAIKFPAVKRMLRFSISNYLVEFISGAPKYILPLMIVSSLSASANAYFFMAYNIAQIAHVIPSITGTALFSEGANEYETLRINIIRSAKFIGILLIIVLLLIFFLGDKVLLLIGQEYSENSLGLLLIISFTAIPLAVSELYLALKRVQNKMKPVLYISAYISLAQIGLSYAFISWLGIIGAGWGLLIGSAVVALPLVVVLWREYQRLREMDTREKLS